MLLYMHEPAEFNAAILPVDHQNRWEICQQALVAELKCEEVLLSFIAAAAADGFYCWNFGSQELN